MSDPGSKASRHEHVGNIFLKTAELEGEARESFLLETCGDDQDLRRDVDGLLLHDESDPSDCLGNVSEWVRDTFADYEIAARALDGLRNGP